MAGPRRSACGPSRRASCSFTLLSLDARAVTIDWVLIGEPGNPPDALTKCFAPECGSVPYAYRISQTEVTVAQYVEFLNAVDPKGVNALGLYSPLMSSDTLNGGVLFDGAIDWDGGPGMGTPDPQCSVAYRNSEARTCGLGAELALLLPLVRRATRRARGVR